MGVLIGGGAKTKEKKTLALKKARALWPHRTGLNEENADAFLIAEYGWRNETKSGTPTTRRDFV
jgi:hypothetical protein